MRTPRSFALAVATVAAALTATAVTSAAAGPPEQLSGQQRRVVQEATKAYRDIEVALADGYVAVGGCAALPGVGGMGYHYLKPDLVGDGVVDPAQPELLVYHQDRQGRLRLGAVEYFVIDADQDVSTDDDRPFLFGEFPFDGPMEGHEEGMPVHYDLHVWIYAHNPDGQLEGWNPRVSCP